MVGVLGLLVGYALLLGVVQLLIYRYYREGQETGDERAVTAPGSVDRDVDEVAGGRDADRDVRRCPHCGAPNESEAIFDYCRQCARQLRV